MAEISAEGAVRIVVTDVLSWLGFHGAATSDIAALGFSVEEDALIFAHQNGKRESVDGAEFWAWVRGKHLPQDLHFETAFGVPKLEGAFLRINFAWSNHSDPRSWVKQPACLFEWDEQGSSSYQPS